jgi:hypothetical protein
VKKFIAMLLVGAILATGVIGCGGDDKPKPAAGKDKDKDKDKK